MNERQVEHERADQEHPDPDRSRGEQQDGQDITVVIDRQVQHPCTRRSSAVAASCMRTTRTTSCTEGDLVMIEECRPLSRTKSWRLVKVVEKAAE